MSDGQPAWCGVFDRSLGLIRRAYRMDPDPVLFAVAVLPVLHMLRSELDRTIEELLALLERDRAKQGPGVKGT